MLCLFAVFSLAVINIKDYPVDVVCYGTVANTSVCDNLEKLISEQARKIGIKIGAFVKVNPDTVNTCLNDLKAYPVWVILTSSTTGQKLDFFEMSQMKRNHIIEFSDYTGSQASSLASHLETLAFWGQAESGMFASQSGIETAANDFMAQETAEESRLTIHLKSSQTSDQAPQIDCLFAKNCSFDLLSVIKVQAAVFRSVKVSTNQFLANYCLADWRTWGELQRGSATSSALYIQNPDAITAITFESDKWVLQLQDDFTSISLRKHFIGEGGQFSIVQVVEPGTELQLTLNPPQSSETKDTIISGVNFSIQTRRDLMLSLIPDFEDTEETDAAPNMSVTFRGNWDNVNLVDKEFIFEGRTEDSIAVNNQPAAAAVSKRSISSRPSGSGESNDDSSKPPLGLIIGCTVAAVVVVAAIIIGVVLFLRFRKNAKSPESSGGEGVEE